MMPLGLLSSGEQAEITEIRERKASHKMEPDNHSCSDDQTRIEDMGLRIGKDVEVLNNKGRGPLLLKVDESRIAIGRGMAMKIMVRRKG